MEDGEMILVRNDFNLWFAHTVEKFSINIAEDEVIDGVIEQLAKQYQPGTKIFWQSQQGTIEQSLDVGPGKHAYVAKMEDGKRRVGELTDFEIVANVENR